MNIKTAFVSGNRRYIAITAMAAGFAVLAATPSSALRGVLGQDKPGRKSTDAPLPAKGKLGQDLFLAILHGDNAGVKSLIGRGADCNAKNGLEFTPLYIAAAAHQVNVMNELLDAGAQVDAGSPYGSPLLFAAGYGNVEGVDLLLSKGADPNTVRSDGMNALMMAANLGVPPIVGKLLEAKVDVNKADDNGETALSYAARGGHDDVGKILLQAGAKVDAVDNERLTPLMHAASTGQAGFVQLLLASGANVNAKDAKGRTALIYAAASGDYPKVIQELKQAGGDASIKDADGQTAATLAVIRQRGGSVSLLGHPSVSPAIAPRSAVNAVKASLKTMQASMFQFTRNTSCLSCHQEGLGRIATGMAHDQGFLLDGRVQQAQTLRINGMVNGMQPLHTQALKNPEVMKQIPLIEINEVTTAYAWLMAGMAQHKQPRTPASEAMAMVLARQQSPDGQWSFSLPRVPMQSSPFTFTALAVKALQSYSPIASVTETKTRIVKAMTWLTHAQAKSSEDRAMRLLGLKWSGAEPAVRAGVLGAIKADQRADGGWSQLPELQSDAYATGQALYALREGGGMSVTNPVYRRGVAFLLRTQDKDGSWFVSKRAIPANNYLDTGFPNGESQYSSFNGTCWATMALLETVGKQKRNIPHYKPIKDGDPKMPRPMSR